MKDKKIKRQNNLLILKSIFDNQKLQFWLSGWSLLYAYKANHLSELPFDEIGTWYSKFLPIKNTIFNQLSLKGFTVIEKNKYVIRIKKDGLIININNYYINQKHCLTNELKLPIDHYKNFNHLNFIGKDFNIPNKTNNLLEFIFHPSKFEKTIRLMRSHLIKDVSPYKYYSQLYQFILSKSPGFISNLIRVIFRKQKIIINKLSYEDFKSLKFNSDEFDSVFRSKHINKITNYGENLTVGQIISFFSIKGKLEEVKKSINETPMNNLFNQPIYYSRKFWQTGNNYFFYSLYFSFRKKIIPYSKSNNYIINKNKYQLYSNNYFSNLDIMNEKEISILLKNNPIEIDDEGFRSGRHRVAAMIGRIINNKSYIPILVYKL